MAKKAGLQDSSSADVSAFMKPVPEASQARAEGGETKKRTARRAPTLKQMKAAKLISENLGNPKPKTQGEILREAGYSKETSETPAVIIQSESFQDLLEQFLPDDNLAEVHKRLLNTRKLEHMVFPLYHDPDAELEEPEGEWLEPQGHGGSLKRQYKITEGATLTDDEIVDMLAEVNCQVRKIVHGDMGRHVYYWTHDANAQTKALELGYKLKGHIGKDGGGEGTGKILALFGNNTVNFIKNPESNHK